MSTDSVINSTPDNNLQIWWTSKTFDGKEFCTLQENGALTISFLKDKIIATLNSYNGDAVITSLLEKFSELLIKTEELKKEWDDTEDKIKLSSKVMRLREYISHTNAIGNFSTLLKTIENWENHLENIIAENYKAKAELVAKAESIVIENNNWKDATQRFRELTEQWKTLGFIDKKRNEELWTKFEAIKNSFFEKKREHQDDIDKEMLQNLDLKMEIVEKAEALTDSENWKETTEQYKQLLEEWKNTGRTIQEKNEILWQRFISAKNIFFDRKKIHSDQIQAEQEANYALKLALVEKAEALKNSTEWNSTSSILTQLMTEWKNIGHVPAEHNTSLWEKFVAARDSFFQAKRIHTETYKATLDENYTKKIELINRAEELKNSNNWREASEEMNILLDKWKQIGHVAKEHSEVLWNQFLSARKYFFNRKDEDRARRKQYFEKQKTDRLNQTKSFLETLKQEYEETKIRLEEFKIDLDNITQGPKSEELKLHLASLIIQNEKRLKNQEEKIKEVTEQLMQLEHQNNRERTQENEQSVASN
jgi:hypothetical protein